MSTQLNDAVSSKAGAVHKLGDMITALKAMGSEGRNVAAFNTVARHVEAVEKADRLIKHEVLCAQRDVEKANRDLEAMRDERDRACQQLQTARTDLTAKAEALNQQKTLVTACAIAVGVAFLATSSWALWLRWQPAKIEYRHVQVPLPVPLVAQPTAAQKSGAADSDKCSALGAYASAFGCSTSAPRR